MGFFTARRAGGADIPSMYGIYTRSLDDYVSPDAIEYFMLQWPRGQLVAEAITGGTAGAVSSYIMEDGAVSVALLAVDAPFRGRGAGTVLMDRLIPECIAVGAPRVQLEVRTTNAGAISFYSGLGFVRTEVLPHLYSDGGDAYRMALDLGRASAAGIRPAPLRSRSPPRLSR